MKIIEPLRILHFDCECRPGAWIGGDYVSRSLTAVAWCFRDEETTHSAILSPEDTNTRRLLKEFFPAYDAADVVTLHYSRSFDLPLISHELHEHALTI
jgi:hypothetical protein